MARYTGPSTKIARKFGEPIFGSDKYFEKRNYPPGQHGLAAKRKKTKDYSIQLKEKQKVKYMYGVLERQFHNTYVKASRLEGQKGENLIILLELGAVLLGFLALCSKSVLSRREVSLLEILITSENRLAELAGDSGTRTGISCHNSLSFKN